MSLIEKYNELYGWEAAGTPEDAEVQRLAPVIVHGWPVDRRQALVHLARPGGRLLEIGCGAGEVLGTLAPHYEEAVGIEISSDRAARARLNLAHLPNCQVSHVAVEDTPGAELGLFDCIIWADVIEHVVDVIGAMRALARIAAPNAQLVTVTPNVAFLPQRLRVLAGLAPCTALGWFPDEGFFQSHELTPMLDAGHVHYFTYRQVEILYRIAGFTPRHRLGIGTRWSRLRNFWPTLLSGQVCIDGLYTGSSHASVEP